MISLYGGVVALGSIPGICMDFYLLDLEKICVAIQSQVQFLLSAIFLFFWMSVTSGLLSANGAVICILMPHMYRRTSWCLVPYLHTWPAGLAGPATKAWPATLANLAWPTSAGI